MPSSVQDLLLAAQSQSKSPFTSLLEGLTQGIGQGYQAAPERMRTLLALQQEQAAQRRAEDNDKMLRGLVTGQVEAGTQNDFKGVGGPATPPHGGLRLAQITTDPKTGYLRPEFKVAEPKPANFQLKEYQAADGKNRLGRFDPNINGGKLMTSPDDPLASVNVNLGEKQEQYQQKRLTALGDALDPTKQTRGSFAVAKGVFDRAEKLQTLANAYQSGNLDSRQVEELAIGLNAMLSGANVGAASQVAALVPKTAMGNVQKFKEWLTNDPQGTNQQAFIQRMMGTVEREKATAADQIERTQMQRVARYSDLEKSAPDEFINVLQSAGIDPERYKAWKKNGYKPISAVQQPEGTAAPAPAAAAPAAPAAPLKVGRFTVEVH